jgi:hypothetical protein
MLVYRTKNRPTVVIILCRKKIVQTCIKSRFDEGGFERSCACVVCVRVQAQNLLGIAFFVFG